MSVNSYEIGTGHVTIETEYDGKHIRRTSYRQGHAAGTSFYHGFRRGSLYRFNKLWKTFFKPLNNLKKWLTRLRMPAILSGLLGSVLTLVPTLSQLGSVVGVGMIPAFLSWFSTIGLIRGILGKLHSDIKGQTLKALNDAAGEFKELATEAAKPGLNAVLEEAIKHTPILNKYIKELGGHLSDVGFAMRDVLRNGQNIDRIKSTLNDTAEATGIWYSLLDEAAEVLIALASSGAPLFLRFTRSMERVGLTIHDWIMLQKATGALDRYLSNAYLTLEKFGRGGRDFLIGLFNIINGGVFGTEKIADSFERWGASFRKWSEDADNVDKVRNVISWFTSHVDEFFRFAAAATAVQLALTQISKIKSMALFVRTLIGLGPVGFALFAVGAALSSLMGGFVLAYTHSEKFRKKLYELFGMIKDRLGPIITDWWKWMRDELAPVLEELAVKGIGELSKSIGSLLNTIDENKEGLAAWRPIILDIIKIISYLTGFTLKALIFDLQGVITVLGWLGRIFGGADDWLEKFNDAVDRTVNNVVAYFGRLKERAGEVVDNTAAAFRALPGKITRFLKSLPGALARSLEAAMEGAVYIVAYGLGKIVDFFVRLPGRVISQINILWDTTKRLVAAGITAVVSFFVTLPAKISGWWERTWKAAKETTERWFVNIVDFVRKLPGRVLTALVNLPEKIRERFSKSWEDSQKTTTDKSKSIMAFIGKIPGRAWSALVKLKDRLVDRFAEGWSAATGTSKDKVKGIINFVLGIPGRAFDALRKLAGQLKSRAASGWQAFRDEASRKVSSFITWVSQIPGRVVRGLGAIGTKLKESGRQLIQGLLAGVQARIREIGGLGSWFKANLVDPIVKGVKNFFGIKSPSKVFQGIGQYLVAGLWKGMASNNSAKMIGKIFGGMDDALIAMVGKGMISLTNLPAKALAKLGGMFDDLLGGGGGSAGGLVGFARLAWDVFSKAFGLNMGGWRAHGSVPGSDHPKGKAIDVMTTNPIMHRLIIELFKRLPGAKYWISMRRIAMAREGWKSRPYSGPSPHTDHVHTSFYRQGGRLPEDVLGVGKRGLYQFHRGEDVIRRNQTTNNNRGGDLVIHNLNLNVDPKSIKDIDDIISMVQRIRPTARMGARVA